MKSVISVRSGQASVYSQAEECKTFKICNYLANKIKTIWNYILNFLCCRKGSVIVGESKPSKESLAPLPRVRAMPVSVKHSVQLSSAPIISSSKPYPSTAILSFYAGELKPEPLNQGFVEVLAMTDAELEHGHTFIQWLFPLKTISKYNPRAALFDDITVEEFRKSLRCKENMLTALNRMLQFYGLKITNNVDIVISRAANFSERSALWMTRNNHNYLRIRRIIQSLYIVGLTVHAKALSTVMIDIANSEGSRVISEISKELWGNYKSEHTHS